MPTITFDYKNYKGEHGKRCVIPISIWYGSTEWHEPQWLLKAYDLGKFALRDFAMRDINDWKET